MDGKKLDSPTVEERLAKLEGHCSALARQNHRLKIAGAMGLVLVGAVVLVGAATPKSTDHSTSDVKFQSVQVREFIVVDAKGTPRARLTVDKDGSGLRVYDEEGTRRATLGVGKDGPGLGLYDEDGMGRAALGVARFGATLVLRDEKGTSRFSVGAYKDGPSLGLFSEKNTPRVMVSVYNDEVDPLRTFTVLGVNEDDGPAMYLVVDKDGSRMSLWDEKGKTIWHAPAPSDAPEEAEAGEE